MKILILSATTGGGHMSAANALKNYIMSVESDAEVNIIDAIQVVSPTLNKVVTGGYVYLATKPLRCMAVFIRHLIKILLLIKLLILLHHRLAKSFCQS